jgi:uncharacterized protein
MDVDAFLASAPLPTRDEINARNARGKPYTLVFLCLGPNRIEDEAEEERLQLAHLQHLTRLANLGKIVMNGPILIEDDIRGVSVYAADVDEARALAEADPKVRVGHLRVEARPWFAVRGDDSGAPDGRT